MNRVVRPTAMLTCAAVTAFAASARAIDRETVLDHAASYTMHEWTMTKVNETASCSKGYKSDFTEGTYRGLPYDWGGYWTLDEFDQQIAAGQGAGSHKSDGILDCTTGVDCSGFLSQIWQSSHQSTSSLHTITTPIKLADLTRGDAINDAGSHVVLFTYETAAGAPIFYEAAGSASKVRINNKGGWAYLEGYKPVRYNEMTDGPATGTSDTPRIIASFPFSEMHGTAGASSDALNSYGCAPELDESGPEVLYRFTVASKGRLHAVVSDDAGVDVDVHLLSKPTSDGCITRDDTEIEQNLDAGTYWLSIDTFVDKNTEHPGAYLLAATFESDEPDPGTAGGAPSSSASGIRQPMPTTTSSASGGSQRPAPPAARGPDDGCALGAGATPMGLRWALVGLVALRVRKRFWRSGPRSRFLVSAEIA